jgi:TPP-dependent pyruvate/acetoin dehydrogenase alpha subunit
VFEVRATAVQKAIDRARTESTPTLLEVRTYRHGPLDVRAPSAGRIARRPSSRSMKRDPIVLLRTHM